MRATAREHADRNGTKRSHTASERLEARVSGEQKAFFQRAAALKGVTLTDFVIASLQEAAVRTVEEHGALRLSLQDRQTFVDALMNPPAPNQTLRRAAGRYRHIADGRTAD